MKHLLCLLLCGLSYAGLAQSARPIRRLAGDPVPVAQLTDRLAHLVDSAQLAGLSVLVLRGGRPVYEHYFGRRDRARDLPLNGQTVSYAASLTKPLVAYLCLRLVDRGVLALDTPVYRYLPRPIASYPKWQDLAQDSDFRRITPRMLLSHSAGLPVLRDLYGPQLRTIAAPGSRFFYSNEGFNLLGTVLEERTGQPLQQLVQEHVFGPLGMSQTSMVWQERFAANFAVGHDRNGAGLGAQKRQSARAAGSMVTTPTDYAAFVRQVQRRRGLTRRSYRELLSPQILVTSRRGWGPGRDSLAPDAVQRGLHWGLGSGLFASPYGPGYWHGGHADGWQNLCLNYPRRRVSIILLSNSDNFEAVAAQILRLCIGDVPPTLEWSGYFDARPRPPAEPQSTSGR